MQAAGLLKKITKLGAQRTAASAMHRRRKPIGRRFERPERVCERRKHSVCKRLRRLSAARAEASARKVFSALSFEERAKEDREAKMIGKPSHASLNDHERLRCFARSFRALGVRRLLHPTFSHRGIKQAGGLP